MTSLDDVRRELKAKFERLKKREQDRPKITLGDVQRNRDFINMCLRWKEEGREVYLHGGLVKRGWTTHDVDLYVTPYPGRIYDKRSISIRGVGYPVSLALVEPPGPKVNVFPESMDRSIETSDKGKIYALCIFNKLIPRITAFLRPKVCIAGSLAKTLLEIRDAEFRSESDIDLFLTPDSTDEDARLVWQRIGTYLDNHRISPFIPSHAAWEPLKDQMICGPNYRLDLQMKRLRSEGK